jgi:aspartate kinase
MGKVSVVGAGMKSHPGVAARVFSTLGDQGINIEMISTSPIKISCVVTADVVDRAVRALHEAFELGADQVEAEHPFGTSRVTPSIGSMTDAGGGTGTRSRGASL